MSYNELAKYFEAKLKRQLKPEEIAFIKQMIKNQKQKSSV
jgi:hypothetical protein